MRSIGIFIILICYGYSSNRFFGWNLYPQSSAEVVADGVFCLLAVAFIMSL